MTTTAPPAIHQPRLSPIARVRLLQAAGVVALIAFWQVFGATKPQWYSQPSRMLEETWHLFTVDKVLPYIEGNFWTMALKSLGALGIGLVISFVLGVTVGFLVGRYRVARVMFDPYLAAFYSVPRVAFVPIMVIWFGIASKMTVWGIGIPLSKFVIASVVVSSAILISFSTAVGVRETLNQYDEVAAALHLSGRQSTRSEGARAIVLPVLAVVGVWVASATVFGGLWPVVLTTLFLFLRLVYHDRRMFLKVLLPGSVPFIATGLRLALQRAVVAVIVAEFLVGVPGVGFIIRDARSADDADRLFAMAVLLMILGVVIVQATKRVEARLSLWRPQAFGP